MKQLKVSNLVVVAGLAVACLAGAIAPAIAAPAAPDKGNTSFMFIATALVLFMTIPGLALFYGGLVRTKNMLSVLMQVFTITCVMMIVWVTYGYSLAFTNGGSLNSFVGGFSKAFLSGVNSESVTGTFSNGVTMYEYMFVLFQMTFACITPALIVGAFAERVKFSALLVFCVAWSTFCYFPIAHMVWYWAGPDAVADAAKAVAAASGDAKAAAQAALDAVTADAGLSFQWGAIDFAGGTVVHINAGIAGLVGALVIGHRAGYGSEPMAPHSLAMAMIGAAMLWVGWFGFNCGSNLEANGTAILAMINTFVATAAAGLSWMLAEWGGKGKPSLLGLISGVVAGLVAVTPASGFAGPMGALVLGLVAGYVCFIFCSVVKREGGYDDSLDVFGIHAAGGIVGAIGTGIVAAPSLGGAGILDYASKPGTAIVANYDIATQVMIQTKAVMLTIVWCAVVSLVLFVIIKLVMGLRPTTDVEREGLDVTSHGERAYNY